MADHPDIERAIREFQADPGRAAGFRRLYETYFGAVRRFFLRRAFRRAETEELTQETFLRVYRHLDDYEHRGHFGAWLFTIAENVCRKEWQKRGTLKRRGIDVPYDETARSADSDADGTRAPRPPADPARQERETHDRERRRILSVAIAELAERQRQCLTFQLRGYRYREIATLLQIAPETVKRHLTTARKSLGQRLGDLDLSALEDRP